MTDPNNPAVGQRTALDLDAILAARWADPEQFPADEWIRAERFWHARRADDERLFEIRAQAAGLLASWSGREARDVGSFGIQVNLETSDLDLGIGYPVDDHDRLIAAMKPYTEYVGERYTRFDTTRLIFVFDHRDVRIEVSALTEADFVVACRMLDEIGTGMTEQERIAHTWVKELLRVAGRMEEYSAWKLVTYARYCQEFNWVPIPERSAD
ncbi:hypothetical protein DQ384_38665 [Sphaerisporangium album]|uniref:Uncharacterized protein n=1 Tax=Sphaerisporangium album TaxID=509200 RepID=A0A367EN86_9ACTN|nr:hypothetical protein [Sphaerisporangium album]RCG19055.1 hypothetical protein DQ384_38665 [Sphaerisporangium album]